MVFLHSIRIGPESGATNNLFQNTFLLNKIAYFSFFSRIIRFSSKKKTKRNAFDAIGAAYIEVVREIDTEAIR